VMGNPRGSSGYGQAHGRAIVGAMGTVDVDDVLALLDTALGRPDLDAAKVGVLGGSYGGSTFLGLLGQVLQRPDLDAGDRLSVFAYGSGCQSEFYEVTLGDDARGEAGRAGVERHLDERLAISIEDYEYLERTREAMVDQRHAVADRSRPDGAYASQYAGQGRLVLAGVDDFRRVYEWS